MLSGEEVTSDFVMRRVFHTRTPAAGQGTGQK
jgi:hypothetical protein